MRAPVSVVLVLSSFLPCSSHAASPSEEARPARGAFEVAFVASGERSAREWVSRCRAYLDAEPDHSQVIAETQIGSPGPVHDGGCTVMIPVTWRRNQRESKVSLGFEVEISSARGDTRRTMMRQGMIVDYPPEGGVATFQVSLNY